jgi:hypothetical protein
MCDWAVERRPVAPPREPQFTRKRRVGCTSARQSGAIRPQVDQGLALQFAFSQDMAQASAGLVAERVSVDRRRRKAR